MIGELSVMSVYYPSIIIMYTGRLAFSQVMDLIPIRTFRRCVERYTIDESYFFAKLNRKVRQGSWGRIRCPGAHAVTEKDKQPSQNKFDHDAGSKGSRFCLKAEPDHLLRIEAEGSDTH